MDYNEASVRAKTSGALVWHYTALDTLTKILDRNYLLATEVNFQNDIRESVTSDAAIQRALVELEQSTEYGSFARSARGFIRDFDGGLPFGGSLERQLEYSSRFILCGSAQNDSLYAWRTYGGGSSIGCAIGLDPEAPLGIVDRNRRTVEYNFHKWAPVIYEPDEVATFVISRLQTIGDKWNAVLQASDDPAGSLFDVLLTELEPFRSSVRAIAKDPSFIDERERRVSIEEVRANSAIVFTPSAMGPRPHLRITSTASWGDAVENAENSSRLPIRAITLGPSAPETAELSVKWLLLTHNYSTEPFPTEYGSPDDWSEAVFVARSGHPYRSA